MKEPTRNRKTAGRRPLRNPNRCFDQPAAMAASIRLLRHHARRPPPAKINPGNPAPAAERNRCYYGIDGHIVEIDTAVKSTCEIVDCQFSQRRVCDQGLGEESIVRDGIGVGMHNGVAEKRIVRTVYLNLTE